MDIQQRSRQAVIRFASTFVGALAAGMMCALVAAPGVATAVERVQTYDRDVGADVVAVSAGDARAYTIAVSDEPLKMTTANRPRAEVIELAKREPQVSRALDLRPRSRVVTKFDVASGVWTVSVREEGGGRDLARVNVKDSDGSLSDVWALPLAQYPPRLTSRLAQQVAYSDKRVQRQAKEWGGTSRMSFDSTLNKDNNVWEVNARDQQRVIRIRIDVSDRVGGVTGIWTGHQIAWEMARGDRYAFGNKINKPWAWWPLWGAFLLIMVLGVRPRGWDAADVVALVALAASHEAFLRGRLDWSVPLAIPPLVWMGARMTYRFISGVPPSTEAWSGPDSSVAEPPVADGPDVGSAGSEGADLDSADLDSADLDSADLDSADLDAQPPARPQRPRPPRFMLPTWLIVLVAVLAIGMRWGVAAWGSNIIDVGYAGVAGASRMLDGKSPYGNMPKDNPHGDTYGPINYAAYVPAVIALGDGELRWGQAMPAARALSIFSDALCIIGLAVLGWRWMGRRAGALLVAGWVTFPFTAWALASHVNDLLMTAALIWAMVFIRSAVGRGALIAVAASIKFIPILVLPIVAHVGAARRIRQSILVGVGVGLVVAVDVALIAVFPGGLARFVEATFGFQLDRESPFSPWGLYELRSPQLMAQGALLMALVLALFRPPMRDARQVAAGVAAALIGAQLVLQHWFYLYIPWFVPFVLLVLIARSELRAAPLPQASMYAHPPDDEHSTRSIDTGS